MKKILLAFLASIALANADVTNVVASKAFLSKNIKNNRR